MAGMAWIRICAKGSVKWNKIVQAVCINYQHLNKPPTLGTYAVDFQGQGEWDPKEKATATKDLPSSPINILSH